MLNSSARAPLLRLSAMVPSFFLRKSEPLEINLFSDSTVEGIKEDNDTLCYFLRLSVNYCGWCLWCQPFCFVSCLKLESVLATGKGAATN